MADGHEARRDVVDRVAVTGAKTVRLFAAIYPPADALAKLERSLPGPDQRLRWVPDDQRHVTVAFYGEVDEAVLPDLAARLGRAAARTPSMSLRLAGAGTFPKQAVKARVLWVGVDGEVAHLARLADRCAAAARRCGLAMEDRIFRPHLTVARSRREPVDLRALVTPLSQYEGAPWPVTTLHLVHSSVGPRVTHRTLHEFALSQPGAEAGYQA